MAKVGIIMGSRSDMPTMQAAADCLEQLGVEYEMQIVSAHRTPELLHEYGLGAEENGISVIVAGAGGAAHLPGMVASLTVLPVVGVPISATCLEGQDALLSIVQMPRGVPVATVAIDNAWNGGLMAARILAAQDENLRKKLHEYRRELAEKALAPPAS